MGYFSNGSEGMDFEEAYCSRCVHDEDCPVMLLHQLWNYEQLDRGADGSPTQAAEIKKTALDEMIIRDKNWQTCKMFHRNDAKQIIVKTVLDEAKLAIIQEKFDSLTLEQLEKL